MQTHALNPATPVCLRKSFSALDEHHYNSFLFLVLPYRATCLADSVAMYFGAFASLRYQSGNARITHVVQRSHHQRQ